MEIKKKWYKIHKMKLKVETPMFIGNGEDEGNNKDFIRDYNGKAYIPASSIKGAIRTALFAYIYEKNQNVMDDEMDDEKDKKRKQKSEKIIELFRYIQISDSKSIEEENFKKYIRKFEDESLNSKEGKSRNEFQLELECLKIGTKVTFEIKIEDIFYNKLKDVKVYDITDFNSLLEKIGEFMGTISKKYEKALRVKLQIKKGRISMGGGNGQYHKCIDEYTQQNPNPKLRASGYKYITVGEDKLPIGICILEEDNDN